MLWTVISIAVTAFTVWVLVTAARRTDEPWWKVWLLGRGMFPTGQELRDGRWNKDSNDRSGDQE